jgi:hypothetical protein
MYLRSLAAKYWPAKNRQSGTLLTQKRELYSNEEKALN